MKLKQFFVLLFFKIMAAAVSVGIPAWFIYANLFIDGVMVRPLINVSIALAGVLILLVWSVWIKKKFYRKLQSIDVAEEMGQVPATNFILARILKSIEYVLPFVIIAFLVRGMSLVWPAEAISEPFFWLMYCLMGGVGIMIIHDGFKTHYMNLNAVERNLEMKHKVEQLEQERSVTLDIH